MRVLLINPQRNLQNPAKQFLSPPLGLGYIAAYLRRNGFSVGLIDTLIEGFDHIEPVGKGIFQCGLSNVELESRIRAFAPDVIGISCMFTPRFHNVAAIARFAKKIDPRIRVVVGGMHVSVCPEETLREGAIDFAVLGEGEVPFYELLKKIEAGEDNFSAIGGIAWRQGGDVSVSCQRSLVGDLDSLPYPARDLLSLEEYFRRDIRRDALTTEQKHTSLISSRGCPYSCTFCSAITHWGRDWRKRSAHNVLAEIDQLVNQYKIRELSFEDDNLSLDSARLEEICSGIIERRLKIKWNTPNGIAVHNLSRPLIRLMKQSGCRRLNFGIESGDEEILNKVMRKNVSLDKVRQVVDWAAREGIVTLGYFVLGMPGETPQSIERTIEFAKSIRLDEIAVFIATPFPGTQLYRTCKERGYLKRDYGNILCEDGIESEIFFETPDLSAAELLRKRAAFYAEFYRARGLRNPLYYLQRAIRNPGAILRYIRESAFSQKAQAV